MTITSGGGRFTRTTLTNDGGIYQFGDVPAGIYTLRASATGFVAFEWGDDGETTGSRVLTVSAGQSFDKADFNLPAGGVIAGRVIDEAGEAVDGVPVVALRVEYAAGAERLTPLSTRNRLTDDRGHYRLFALPPGEYYVAACPGAISAGEPSRNELPGYALTFLPASPSLSGAQRISVSAAQEILAAQIVLTATPTYRLSGMFVDSAGQPRAEVQLVLLPGTDASIGVLATVQTGRGGAFAFSNVPPGTYLLQALPTSGGGFASLPVSIGSDTDNVILQGRSGRRMAGEFTFEENMKPDFPPRGIEMHLAPVDFAKSPLGRGADARVANDWTFQLTDLWGPHVVEVVPPAGWALKKVALEGEDVTDQPVDFDRLSGTERLKVTMTNRLTTLSGAVADARGNVKEHATVVVFPSDPHKWAIRARYVRRIVTGDDGRFVITGLPPGEYFAVALERLPNDNWLRPSLLDALRPSATAVSLNPSAPRQLELRVVRAPATP